MEKLTELVTQPWPWYIAGPLIGLMVPALLIIGNKSFGVSSTMRHICASCAPANIDFFKYDWKKESWNLYFSAGIVVGGIIASLIFNLDYALNLNPTLKSELSSEGISASKGLVPTEIFSWSSLSTIKGLIIIVVGGFLVGFGSRYAGGCTSGHAIMGLSTLQWPSLIATCCFMAGGLIASNFLVPLILSL